MFFNGLWASPGQKDRAFFAARTNMGIYLAGQPRAIHDGIGAVFTRSSRMRGLGLEHRFNYFWADGMDASDDETDPVSFRCALSFLQEVWVSGRQSQHQLCVAFLATARVVVSAA